MFKGSVKKVTFAYKKYQLRLHAQRLITVRLEQFPQLNVQTEHIALKDRKPLHLAPTVTMELIILIM